jgi:hypothetical protein
MQYYCEKGVLGDAVLGSWSPVLYAAKTTTTGCGIARLLDGSEIWVQVLGADWLVAKAALG